MPDRRQSMADVVAANVRRLRGRLGWTQADLQVHLEQRGVKLSRPTIIQIERGRRAATVGTRPLDLTLDELDVLSDLVTWALGNKGGPRDVLDELATKLGRARRLRTFAAPPGQLRFRLDAEVRVAYDRDSSDEGGTG